MTSTAEIIGRGAGVPKAARTGELPRLTAPPLTQEDMDKRIRERRAREAAAQNPLPGIIPTEHLHITSRQFGNGAIPTTCQSRRQPVYEQLQVAIEHISLELDDFHVVTSDITRAENIRQEAGVEIETFIIKLSEARAATKYADTTGKITKRNKDGKLMKMSYFFSVLRQRLGLNLK